MRTLKKVALASGKTLLIRTYEPPDYPAIRDNLKAEEMFDEIRDSEESLHRMISENSDAILVATVDNQIVGSLFLLINGLRADIYRLVVTELFRGKGVVDKLLQAAEETLRTKGIKRVGLFYRANNHKLGKFYGRRGWQKLPFLHQAMCKDL